MPSTTRLTPAELVEQGYELRGGIYLGRRTPVVVRAAIGQMSPVHIVARQTARDVLPISRSADCDAYEAADWLFRRLDIVVHHALPSADTLAASLKNSTAVRTHVDQRTGLPFVCTAARIDLRPQGTHPFLTLLAGSVSKVDSLTRRSPVVESLVNDIRDARPGLLFTSQPNRLARQGWGYAPLWHELNRLKGQGQNSFVGDGQTGLWRDGELLCSDHLCVVLRKDFEQLFWSRQA